MTLDRPPMRPLSFDGESVSPDDVGAVDGALDVAPGVAPEVKVVPAMIEFAAETALWAGTTTACQSGARSR